jgi:hypothetical protein
MVGFLEETAAKLEGPAPAPVFSPTVMRDLAAIQEAVLVEQEVKKGDAGHPAVTVCIGAMAASVAIDHAATRTRSDAAFTDPARNRHRAR